MQDLTPLFPRPDPSVPNGNLTSKVEKVTGATTTYAYDVENQLIGIDLPDGRVVQYRYDGLGRRIEKNVNGTMTRDVYDNEDLLLEFEGTTTLQAGFLHGPGIDEPVLMERDLNGDGFVDPPSERLRLLADGLGSIRCTSVVRLTLLYIW